MAHENGVINTTDAPCRDYTETETKRGKTTEIRGTACRQPDGSWLKVDTPYRYREQYREQPLYHNVSKPYYPAREVHSHGHERPYYGERHVTQSFPFFHIVLGGGEQYGRGYKKNRHHKYGKRKHKYSHGYYASKKAKHSRRDHRRLSSRW